MVVEIVCSATGKDNNVNFLIFAQLSNQSMQSGDGFWNNQIDRWIRKFYFDDFGCYALNCNCACILHYLILSHISIDAC